MPYELKREGSGYKIVSEDTGAAHSNKPLPRQRALAQMRALYANVPDAQDNIPSRARGGKVNLSGKQKKKPQSQLQQSADSTPEPNGVPPLMALHNKVPGLKRGGFARIPTQNAMLRGSKGKLPEGSPGEEKGESAAVEKKEQESGTEKPNFIAGAIKKPGALHEELGVPKGEKIPAGKLAKAAKSKGKLGQRARFAETLKKLK